MGYDAISRKSVRIELNVVHPVGITELLGSMVKKSTNLNWSQNLMQQLNYHKLQVGVKMVGLLRKKLLQFLIDLNIRLSYGPVFHSYVLTQEK